MCPPPVQYSDIFHECGIFVTIHNKPIGVYYPWLKSILYSHFLSFNPTSLFGTRSPSRIPHVIAMSPEAPLDVTAFLTLLVFSDLGSFEDSGALWWLSLLGFISDVSLMIGWSYGFGGTSSVKCPHHILSLACPLSLTTLLRWNFLSWWKWRASGFFPVTRLLLPPFHTVLFGMTWTWAAHTPGEEQLHKL